MPAFTVPQEVLLSKPVVFDPPLSKQMPTKLSDMRVNAKELQGEYPTYINTLDLVITVFLINLAVQPALTTDVFQICTGALEKEVRLLTLVQRGSNEGEEKLTFVS